MKKRAFTLAEVIITLGAIGIIAALLLPALMSSVDKNAWTGSLKTINNVIPNGFAQMIAEEGVINLRDSRLWSDCVAGADITSSTSDAGKCVANSMKRYFQVTSLEDGIPSDIKVYGIGGTDKTSTMSDTIRFVLQNGVTLNIRFNSSASDLSRTVCQEKRDLGGSLCGNAADIYVDVNGNKRPNTIGRDIYGFVLSPDGRLYPRGGKDVAIFTDNGTEAAWKTNCAAKKQEDLATTCTDPFELTARVIDEGYKINY